VVSRQADFSRVKKRVGSHPEKVVSTTPIPKLNLDGTPTLAFQPAVDLATGCLLGFEALLRWYDSDGNYVPPNVLIPRAEAQGQMTALNAWVLSEACTQAARWPSLLQVAVNCTIFQLRRGEVAASAIAALERSGLNPDRLSVEVTETSVTDNEAASDLDAITRLGIQLSIDDITTDGLDPDNLRDCVVNTIKIDAALIAGLTKPDSQSRIIVESIVKLCYSLGVCTVAEAVETAEQVAILRTLGAGAAQGYYFSHPLSADDAFELAAMNPLPHFSLSDPDLGAPPADIDAGAGTDTPMSQREPLQTDSPAGYMDELEDHAAAMRAVGVPVSSASES
jgi:EAL domain-containing protein (putative c-di-GMP-specific phosphodiesterase class I)